MDVRHPLSGDVLGCLGMSGVLMSVSVGLEGSLGLGGVKVGIDGSLRSILNSLIQVKNKSCKWKFV